MRTKKPVIIIDSCTDLPYDFIENYRVPVVHLTFHFEGRDNKDDFFQSLSSRTFYNALRSGKVSTTSQVNADDYINIFRPYIEEGRPIISLTFSSALSGSYNSSILAKSMLLDEYPDADITLIDTKSASLGSGLIAWNVVKMLEKGASKEEIIDWVENNKLKVAHWFTVDDLNHLKRGGRITGAAAFLGSMLDIKPILHVDDEGRLVPVTKVKGRKKSIRALFEKLEESIINPEKQTIFISHGDAEEDAQYLADLIKAEYNVQGFIINNIGPVIGSHSGPGTVALFFFASER
ncbi:MAG: DegV family protein [Caldicoprobacterales bacterium]|jgi:DegV family protein with EDD domain|nr:DegV family protein [Clostridiales bacterium]